MAAPSENQLLSRSNYSQSSSGNPVTTRSDISETEIVQFKNSALVLSVKAEAAHSPLSEVPEHPPFPIENEPPTMLMPREQPQMKSFLGEQVQVNGLLSFTLEDSSPTETRQIVRTDTNSSSSIPLNASVGSSIELRDLDLYCLDNNGWLSNKHMSAGSCLIKDMFPWIKGLDDTLKQCNMNFERPRSRDKYLQYFFLGEHWIIISNINEDSLNTVCVYDSLQNPPSLKLMNLLVQYVLRDDDGIIDIKVMNVDIQPNNHDCGLYAHANATSLALGKDPTQMEHNKYQLRSHFKKCLYASQMLQFPFSFVSRK